MTTLLPEARDAAGRAEAFEPAWWLRNPHAQTLWASVCRRAPQPALVRERFELPDGDFIDLDWSTPVSHECALIVILHGLEGSSRSAYVRTLIQHLQVTGMQALAVHFRGCSGAPNRLDRSYHSGDTGDLDVLVRWLRGRWPHRALGVVGYSLGGNVLLKWLGEQGDAAAVDAAVAVSVPMELALCAERMEIGFSRLYCWRLLAGLKRKMLRKFRCRDAPPLDLGRVRKARGFREFDDAATAPLHGFASADDYYRRSSSRAYLARIRRPALILHAADDPFMTPGVLPRADELTPQLTLEISSHGGHVGFVSGIGPLGLVPHYWLERRIGAYLQHHLS